MSWGANLRQSLDRWSVLRTDATRRLVDASTAAAGPEWIDSPMRSDSGAVDFSPRLAVLLLELLEVRVGHRVTLPEPRPERLALLLQAAGAILHDAASNEPADRAVVLEPQSLPVELWEGGFALHVSLDADEESLFKRIWTGSEWVDMGLADVVLSGRRTIEELLEVEGLGRRVLLHNVTTPEDFSAAHAVDTAWDPAVAHGDMDDDKRDQLRQARVLFHLAYVHQAVGEVDLAADLYGASLLVHPTAEAHTFLGWVHSVRGDLDAAIAQCRAAIETDPSFGNPYNDIGAYLLEQGRPQEALPWLEQALEAPRYEARHYAYCNVGRSLAKQGRIEEAIHAFRQALSLAPDYAPAKAYLRRLRSGEKDAS